MRVQQTLLSHMEDIAPFCNYLLTQNKTNIVCDSQRVANNNESFKTDSRINSITLGLEIVQVAPPPCSSRVFRGWSHLRIGGYHSTS